MFWRSYNIQLLRFYVKFRVEFRVEFIGKRIHYSVILGVYEAKFYTYKNPETPANKGKTAHTSGFHVGASNRNRTLLNSPKKPWNKGIFFVCVEFRVECQLGQLKELRQK